MGRVDYEVELAQTSRKFHIEKKGKINPGFYKLIYNKIFVFVFSTSISILKFTPVFSY